MQLGAQYRATERFKLRAGYALAENPIDGSVGNSIGPVNVPGGIKSVKYLQSQFAIVNQHRFAAGFGYEDLFPGFELDAFAGGMFPATEFLGDSTRIDISSYWIGLGLTWHFDRPQPRPGRTNTAVSAL